MTKTITPKVNICHLIVEMANECQSYTCTIGVKMALGALDRLTKRACELNDPEPLKELDTLGLVEISEDEDNNGNFVKA